MVIILYWLDKIRRWALVISICDSCIALGAKNKKGHTLCYALFYPRIP